MLKNKETQKILHFLELSAFQVSEAELNFFEILVAMLQQIKIVD